MPKRTKTQEVDTLSIAARLLRQARDARVMATKTDGKARETWTAQAAELETQARFLVRLEDL